MQPPADPPVSSTVRDAHELIRLVVGRMRSEAEQDESFTLDKDTAVALHSLARTAGELIKHAPEGEQLPELRDDDMAVIVSFLEEKARRKPTRKA